MDFDYFLSAGIIYPLIHVLCNYYLKNQNWAMGMAVYISFSHVFIKYIICGEKFKAGLINSLGWSECFIFGIYTLEFTTMIIIIFVISNRYGMNITKQEIEYFIIFQILTFSAKLPKSSNICFLFLFELAFIAYLSKVELLSKEIRIKAEIIAVCVAFLSYQTNFLNLLEFPLVILNIFSCLSLIIAGLKKLFFFILLPILILIGSIVYIISKTLPSLSIVAFCLSLFFCIYLKLERKVWSSQSYLNSRVHRKVLQIYYYDKKMRSIVYIAIFGIMIGVTMFCCCQRLKFKNFEFFTCLSLMILGIPLAFIISIDTKTFYKYHLALNYVPILVSLIILDQIRVRICIMFN